MHKNAQEYTGSIQWAKNTKQKGGKTKNYSLPQQEPIQPTQSIKDKELPLMYTWIHLARLLRNELLRLWFDISSSSNSLWFLFFHIVQKIHKRAALQTFSCFLPTKETCHPSRVSLIEAKITQGMSNKENTNCHNILALAQWKRMWSMDSASSLRSGM